MFQIASKKPMMLACVLDCPALLTRANALGSCSVVDSGSPATWTVRSIRAWANVCSYFLNAVCGSYKSGRRRDLEPGAQQKSELQLQASACSRSFFSHSCLWPAHKTVSEVGENSKGAALFGVSKPGHLRLILELVRSLFLSLRREDRAAACCCCSGSSFCASQLSST